MDLTPDTALGSHGFTPWERDREWWHTSVGFGSDDCVEGTDRLRTGILFAYLDVVLGSPPSGIMNPTVDLQVRLFAPPTAGRVHFRSRTLRLGRTLGVGEAEMRYRPDASPFGVSVATFVNQPVPFPERRDDDPLHHGEDVVKYGPLSEAVRLAPGTFDLEVDLHTVQGTVGGATIGFLAELAAADLMGDGGERVALDELDVRFVNKVRGGPIRAVAAAIGGRGDATTVRVEILDVGNGNRLTSYALAVCRPLSAPRPATDEGARFESVS